ncbi:lipocalin-like domain-containing protein [Dyella sp. 2RAB6]|uniref:lipocalin-like domain-containing protein n=1 Tax=Dyella sp. 2RAB6 TaxID=3232992 RepID=UPI003F9120E4
MLRHRTLTHRTFVASGALLVALFASFAQAAAAAPQDQAKPAMAMAAMPVPAWLVGTWTLVRCDNVYPDGRRVELYGHDPQGQWMIDSRGHYSMVIARATRTPFAVNDKSKGTPEEYRAASLDLNAHYGTVAVQDDKMTSHIVQATFPNWVGRGGTTGFTRDGDQLTYIVAKPSSGSSDGAHGEVVWRKAD